MLRRIGIGIGTGTSALVANHCYRSTQIYDPHKGITTQDMDQYLNPSLSTRVETNFSFNIFDNLAKTLLLFQGDFQIHGKENLEKYVYNRGDTPIITAANHSSYLDFLILPLISHANIFNTLNLINSPWTATTFHVLYGNLRTLIAHGQIIPTISNNVVNELNDKIKPWSSFELMKYVLQHKRWLHLFPEGRIYQEFRRNEQGSYVSSSGLTSKPHDVCGPFQWGIAKLVCAYPDTKVLCFGHAGLENIMTYLNFNYDTKWSFFQPISVRIGKPLEFKEMIQQFRDEGRQDSELYVAITNIIREETMCLRKQALEDIKP